MTPPGSPAAPVGGLPAGTPPAVRDALATDDASLADRWRRLHAWIEERFGRDAGLEAVLFLIGIQSRGRGYERKLKKEAKQDLVMEGTYCAFEALGLYERVGADADGAWVWEPAVPRLPKLAIEQQEKLLKAGVLRYFADLGLPPEEQNGTTAWKGKGGKRRGKDESKNQ